MTRKKRTVRNAASVALSPPTVQIRSHRTNYSAGKIQSVHLVSYRPNPLLGYPGPAIEEACFRFRCVVISTSLHKRVVWPDTPVKSHTTTAQTAPISAINSCDNHPSSRQSRRPRVTECVEPSSRGDLLVLGPHSWLRRRCGRSTLKEGPLTQHVRRKGQQIHVTRALGFDPRSR